MYLLRLLQGSACQLHPQHPFVWWAVGLARPLTLQRAMQKGNAGRLLVTEEVDSS